MPFLNLEDIEERELFPGCRGRFIHTENMTFVFWNITAKAPLPEHTHPHEQVVNMLDGEFSLTVAGETKILKPGDIVVIPGNVVHSGMAHTNCRILDVFHPVREDYR